MLKQNKNYNLIREDIDNEYLEYFDFETMSFVNRVTKSMDLSTIDSLTTMFLDGNDLSEYIDKINNEENDYNYSYKIIYTTSKTKEEKVLKVIWDDIALSSLSKLADGKVDFSSDYNYYTFLLILEDIKNPKSGLVKRINTSKKESYRLSDENKKIIDLVASNKKSVTFKDLVDIFSDYKEYRALYLNYKYNNLDNEIPFKERLRKIKERVKEE